MSQSTVDVETYLQAYDQIEQEIEGLSEEQLKWKAAPESWSVTEVLAHLVDHSIVVSFRIREILSGSRLGCLPLIRMLGCPVRRRMRTMRRIF